MTLQLSWYAGQSRKTAVRRKVIPAMSYWDNVEEAHAKVIQVAARHNWFSDYCPVGNTVQLQAGFGVGREFFDAISEMDNVKVDMVTTGTNGRDGIDVWVQYDPDG